MIVAMGFLTSLLISFFAIPSIIRIAELKNLMDQPGQRKKHLNHIPTLGGVAIFAGLIFSLSFWTEVSAFGEMKYFIAGLLIIFFMGIKDDLYDLVHYKKMITQIAVALMLVHFSDVRITSLYRIFGVQDIPLWASYVITILTIVVIVNAFNLLDGVDALAGSVAAIICLFFGSWFFLVGYEAMSLMAFSLLGALLGFLYYNRAPAKIFMGDTGSLLIGLVIAVLTIKFIEFNKVNGGPYQITSVPVVAIGILIVPLFDLARVFFIRIRNGRSPLSGDRNHLHHRLLDIGFKPANVSLILTGITALYIALGVALCRLQGELLLLILLGLTGILTFLIERKHTAALKTI